MPPLCGVILGSLPAALLWWSCLGTLLGVLCTAAGKPDGVKDTEYGTVSSGRFREIRLDGDGCLEAGVL